jgi:hypothetical protein
MTPITSTAIPVINRMILLKLFFEEALISSDQSYLSYFSRKYDALSQLIL